MNLLGLYLRQHGRTYLLCAVFALILILCFLLYHLPLAALLYPLLLCLLVGISVSAVDFVRVKKAHDQLQRILSFSDIQEENLPKADGIKEADYRQLTEQLTKEHRDVCRAFEQKYDDMMNYYTVWVHQIKTPITSMYLHLQNEDTEFSRRIGSDLAEIERYSDMVLTFLRLNFENTDYVFGEYDLDEIIKSAVKKFSSEFIGRKLKLIYEPFRTTVLTDEKWLTFVVEQLLSNALKYTYSGSITVALEVGHTLVIRDTGIGIAPEDLPRIFENGYTGYNGRTDKKASGIGLYLCRRICSDLGYTIEAESVLNEGTVIKVNLSKPNLNFE